MEFIKSVGFLQMANFLLLVFILTKLFWRPASEYMAKRAKYIADAISEAEKNRNEAERLLLEYEEKISGYETEARAILSRAERQSQEKKEQLIAQAKEEAKKIKSQADWEIKQNKLQAEADLQTKVAELAVQAASQIIGQNMDSELNRALVEKFLDKVGDVNVH